MPKILVWKCTYDGKLFEDEAKYKAHLRKLARQRAFDRKLMKAKQEKTEFIVNMGDTIKSFDELSKFIVENSMFFFLNGFERNTWRIDEKNVRPHSFEYVTFERMAWNDSVSNSHSCPRSGVQNWGGMKFMEDGTPAPRGYPGWHGRLNIGVRTGEIVRKNKTWYEDGFGGDYFDNTGIHTGTGGGGGCKDGITTYSYEVRLYADDWPAMAAEREKSRAWEAVGGKRLAHVT